MDPVELQTWLMRAAVLLIGATVLGAAASLTAELRRGARRKGRLAFETTHAAPSAPGLFSGLSGTARKLGEQAALANPSQLSALRTRLVRAGYFNRDAVTIYLGVRTVAMIGASRSSSGCCIARAVSWVAKDSSQAALGVGASAWRTRYPRLLMPLATGRGGGLAAAAVAALLAGVAILAPDQVLKSRQTTREREYADGFPDLLDLLVASVEAGLSMDAGVARVADELERRYPSLTTHLRMLTLELRAGRSRKDAWASLSDRLGIDDARALSTMLRQSEEMGTSLGETLSAFANDMRAKRMLRAEEKALALPAKITLPLIFFIFPCLLAVVIMPAAFKMADILGK